MTQAPPIEKNLWEAANKLRKNIDAAEYKHVVLGLIFLRYTSDAFELLQSQLQADQSHRTGTDPQDPNEYRAHNVFFVPDRARWQHLQNHAKSPTIGRIVDEAMDTLEQANPDIQGVLPKVFAKGNLDTHNLGTLIDLISNIALGQHKTRTPDLLGHVFEYFLGQFALAEGKKGGQFYTPKSVVELLVTMLEPYQGRVMDPCCGSGGMFVQSEKFIHQHQGQSSDISLYGQESNQTTWRLCKMNLAIRGIDSSQVKWNNEGSFLKNEHKDVRVDHIIANPPFNDKDWSGHLLRNDARWQYGTPPIGNANYAWIQHFLYHLAPQGQAGFVLSNGSLTTQTRGEGTIRQNLINARLVDCIVSLPTKLFLNTSIPACLWFMRKNRDHPRYRNRHNEILFIDARHMGHLINRKIRELSPQDIQRIADTYHHWRNPHGTYQDIPGFCASTPIEDVQAQAYALTPGRYVGLADEQDGFDFNKRFAALKADFKQQLHEEAILNRRINVSLQNIQT